MKTSESHKKQPVSSSRSGQPFFKVRSVKNVYSGEPSQLEPFFQPSHPVIQSKLTVGVVGDEYEQEADRVAADVVKQIHAPAATDRQTLQRMGEEEDPLQMKTLQKMGEEEEELQMKPPEPLQREAMEEEDLQMKSVQMNPMVQRVGADGGEVSADFERELNRARGGGQNLAPDLQAQMGQAMGVDFSGVRVHTDGQADALNHSVGARAFTTGNDLFFRQGEYQPGSRRGQELIAHELTHVVQQNPKSEISRAGSDSKSTSVPTVPTAVEMYIDPRAWISAVSQVTELINEANEHCFAAFTRTQRDEQVDAIKATTKELAITGAVAGSMALTGGLILPVLMAAKVGIEADKFKQKQKRQGTKAAAKGTGFSAVRAGLGQLVPGSDAIIESKGIFMPSSNNTMLSNTINTLLECHRHYHGALLIRASERAKMKLTDEDRDEVNTVLDEAQTALAELYANIARLEEEREARKEREKQVGDPFALSVEPKVGVAEEMEEKGY